MELSDKLLVFWSNFDENYVMRLYVPNVVFPQYLQLTGID